MKWMRKHNVVHKNKFRENLIRMCSAFNTLYYDVIKILKQLDISERYEGLGFTEFCELVKMKIDDRVHNHRIELTQGNYYKI